MALARCRMPARGGHCGGGCWDRCSRVVPGRVAHLTSPGAFRARRFIATSFIDSVGTGVLLTGSVLFLTRDLGLTAGGAPAAFSPIPRPVTHRVGRRVVIMTP